MANLRTKTLVASLFATALVFAGIGACSGLKSGEDGTDASTSPSGTSTGPERPELLPDGALPDGAEPNLPDGARPSDAAAGRDAQYQFDGGIVPAPTCVGGVSESWVPAPGCIPNAGPGMCTFSKVTRTCKNGNCQKGYCQELDFTAEAPTPPAFVYQVWGAAPDAMWAVGRGVFFWNGSTWSSVDVGVTFDNFTEAYAVAGTTREDVTILTGNFNTGPMTLRRRDAGGVFRSVGQINTAVWGGGLFALGQNRFLVHLGTRGVYLATPSAVTSLGPLYGFASGQHYTNALSGYKANDVLIASAGFDGTYFFDGFEVKKYGPVGHALLYVPDAIAILSSGSKVLLVNPSTGAPIGSQVDLPATLAAPSSVWSGIDGTSLDRIFVCSTDGILARRDGTGAWTRETIPTPMSMNAVFASQWGDVYVAGSRIWHGQ